MTSAYLLNEHQTTRAASAAFGDAPTFPKPPPDAMICAQSHENQQVSGEKRALMNDHFSEAPNGQRPSPVNPQPSTSGFAPWNAAPPAPPSSRPKKVWLGIGAAIALAVAAAITLIVVTSGGGIEMGGKKIANASTFLTDVSKDWKASLPTDGVRLGEEAQCYYQIDAKSDEATGVVACGPVRRFESAAGKVWDTYSFEVSRDPNGNQVATDPAPQEIGVGRPAGELSDADGNEPPKDAEELPPPDLPAAEPDLVVTGISPKSVKLTDVLKPNDAGKIITPDGTISVLQTGTTESLVGDPDKLRPADGYVFQVVQLRHDEATSTPQYGSSDPELSVVLKIDGKNTDITDVFDSYDSEEPYVLASVPESGEAELIVSFDSHDQIVDLATGERQADPITDVDYRSVTTQSISKSATLGPTTIVEDKTGSYTIEAKTAALTSYSGSKFGKQGYASEGNAWLVLTFEDDTTTDCCLYSADSKYGYTGWTVSADGGAALPATIVSEGIAVFSVPSTAVDFAFSLTTTVTYKGYNKPAVALDFGPAAFETSFPT